MKVRILKKWIKLSWETISNTEVFITFLDKSFITKSDKNGIFKKFLTAGFTEWNLQFSFALKDELWKKYTFPSKKIYLSKQDILNFYSRHKKKKWRKNKKKEIKKDFIILKKEEKDIKIKKEHITIYQKIYFLIFISWISFVLLWILYEKKIATFFAVVSNIQIDILRYSVRQKVLLVI